MSARIQATQGTTGSVTADISSKDSFTTTGATVGTTETSIVIPAGTKSFRLQAADIAGVAVLTIAGAATGTGSSTTSFDIFAGSSYQEDFLTGTSAVTIYIKSSKAGTPVQVLYWT